MLCRSLPGYPGVYRKSSQRRSVYLRQKKKEWLSSQFEGLCAEMEGAAIAQASYLNHVPFLIIRAISDKADDSATMDYPEFEAMAAENSVKLLADIVRQGI